MADVRDVWAQVHGGRAADFERVFGTACVPVISPLPHVAHVPGFEEPQPVFLLDLGWVDEIGRRDRLVAFIAERFGLEPAVVVRDLDRVGVPVLAADVILHTEHPQPWLFARVPGDGLSRGWDRG